MSFPGLDIREVSLLAHNHYRRKHDVPPVIWSDELAAHAQEWADYLGTLGTMKHSAIDTRDGEGENIYSGMGSRVDGKYATRQWYNEIKDYDFDSPPTSFQMNTGHFTQVIWAETREIGLGRAKSEDGMDFIVARYFPEGNLGGEFVENVKPIVEVDTASSSESESEGGCSDDGDSLGYYSSDDNDEPGHAIDFKEVRIVPDEPDNLDKKTSEITIGEPVEHASWRSRKDAYLQHGMEYVIVHGKYD